MKRTIIILILLWLVPCVSYGDIIENKIKEFEGKIKECQKEIDNDRHELEKLRNERRRPNDAETLMGSKESDLEKSILVHESNIRHYRQQIEALKKQQAYIKKTASDHGIAYPTTRNGSNRIGPSKRSRQSQKNNMQLAKKNQERIKEEYYARKREEEERKRRQKEERYREAYDNADNATRQVANAIKANIAEQSTTGLTKAQNNMNSYGKAYGTRIPTNANLDDVSDGVLASSGGDNSMYLAMLDSGTDGNIYEDLVDDVQQDVDLWDPAWFDKPLLKPRKPDDLDMKYYIIINGDPYTNEDGLYVTFSSAEEANAKKEQILDDWVQTMRENNGSDALTQAAIDAGIKNFKAEIIPPKSLQQSEPQPQDLEPEQNVKPQSVQPEVDPQSDPQSIPTVVPPEINTDY